MIVLKRSTLFFLIFIISTVVIIFAAAQGLRPKFHYAPPQTVAATALKPSKPLGAFQVTDTSGNIFTEKSLRGYWTLMFFGYTRCPDICPKTLGIIRDSWNQFAANREAPPVRFVFADISKQPTPYQDLKLFLHNYNPVFIGLTADQYNMQQLSDQLGIYAQQTDGKLDHTAALMLIDPQGRLTAVFTPPFTATELAQDLKSLTL